MAVGGGLSQFEDLDTKEVYRRCENALKQASTRNVVIEFDKENAKSAVDLDEMAMRSFLNADNPRKDSTRWINIWGPEYQGKLIRVLSDQYSFTPRLLGIMCSKHSPIHSPLQQNGDSRDKTYLEAHFRSLQSPHSDPEKNGHELQPRMRDPLSNLNHYNVVSEVWHYFSVDWNAKYLCIGYNSLADTSAIPGDESTRDTKDDLEGEQSSSNKPKGVRTWTWLILCDDGTVISIYETLFPHKKDDLTEQEQRVLNAIRRNLLNVFKQLSKVNDDYRRRNPIHTLDIRPGLSSNLSSNQPSTIKILDSPSLLFYYLFDDWYTTYALVAKGEHEYAHQLETLRRNMFVKPQVPLINRLHRYGRELAVLKRMYQSYALIIERILGRQRPVDLSNTLQAVAADAPIRHVVPNSKKIMQISAGSESSTTDVATETPILGAPLSSAATVRFERLLDRINHFALSEIQECLDEKESLVLLNFNLLAMKESQAVERLTRITILLAKVTILFMPVSIMTGYFSTTLTDLADRYTIKTYWICFAVIIFITFLFLLVFGQASGTVEGKPIYRTLSQIAWDTLRLRLSARSLRKRRQ